MNENPDNWSADMKQKAMGYQPQSESVPPSETILPVDNKGDSCLENVVGMIIFWGIVLIIIIAAWQDPTNQGKVCLSLFFGPLVLFFVLRRRWRKKQGAVHKPN